MHFLYQQEVKQTSSSPLCYADDINVLLQSCWYQMRVHNFFFSFIKCTPFRKMFKIKYVDFNDLCTADNVV